MRGDAGRSDVWSVDFQPASGVYTVSKEREPFSGRYFGILDVEGEDGGFLALYPNREAADAEVMRRRALDPEDDDHLTEYHQVFPADLAGTWWNSIDPEDAENPPDIMKIVHDLAKAARAAVNGIEPMAASVDDLLCDLKRAANAAEKVLPE